MEGTRQQPTSPVDRLTDLLAEVRQIRSGMEEAFTEVTIALGAGADKLIDLARDLHETMDGIDKLDTGQIGSAITLIAERAGSVIRGSQAELEKIQVLQIKVERTKFPLDRLMTLVKTVEFASHTARIVEAQSLAAADKRTFFSDEIRGHVRESRAMLAEFASRNADLISSIREARVTQEQFFQRYGQRMQQFSQSLADLIAAIHKQVGDLSQHSKVSAKSVRDISDQMVFAVSGMQVGDSVRQRLEHIETALQNCIDRMASESSGAPDPVVAATCTILAALLTSAEKKLGTEPGSILFTLQKLGKSAEAMTRAVGRVAALKGNDSADAVAELRKMFGDGIAMLYSSQNHRRSLDRRIRVLFQSVQDMNEKITQMRRLDQKIRMVSINVSLRSSATQGREGPLFVVPSQFMDLTAEAFAHQKDLVDALEQVRQAADGLDYDPDSELDNKVGDFYRTAFLLAEEPRQDRRDVRLAEPGGEPAAGVGARSGPVPDEKRWIPARSATVQANLISRFLPSSPRKASTGER
jgi:hypothetical protein